jgi:hypothetical protein
MIGFLRGRLIWVLAAIAICGVVSVLLKRIEPMIFAAVSVLPSGRRRLAEERARGAQDARGAQAAAEAQLAERERQIDAETAKSHAQTDRQTAEILSRPPSTEEVDAFLARVRARHPGFSGAPPDRPG